jgi:DNA adenine methylase
MLETQDEYLVRPFLRWAGSKRQLLPKLSKYWTVDCTRYIEPFVGSASLFFKLTPTSAILGDVNAELMATYQQVKGNLAAVFAELGKMKKSKEDYIRLRATKPSTLKPEQRAARLIYLNRFCFNGLYRTNRTGEFNVPFSGDRTGEIPTAEALKRCSFCLQNAELVTGSFENTLKTAQSGDFIYMDPPFSVVARRVFNEYDASVFSQRQLMVLRDWLVQLNNKGIRFLVSYAESEEGILLSKGFYVETVNVRRNIAGFAANRRKTNELLISNVKPTIDGDFI